MFRRFVKFSLKPIPARHAPRADAATWRTTDPDSVFSINPASPHGLLPSQAPLQMLPPRFSDVEDILDKMTFVQKDGSPGLLAKGELGNYVRIFLKNHDLSGIQDPHLLAALFRDYQFLAAAYLLEPSHLAKIATGKYGVARDHLPKSIAMPLDFLGNKLDGHPFLDYAYGYALNNWALIRADEPMTLKNLRMIRQFDGGPDEAGFMLIHVAIAAQSFRQLGAVQKIIHGATNDDLKLLTKGLSEHFEFLTSFYSIFNTMWQASRPTHYLGFRTFIMGVTGNEGDIFPNKVIYMGCKDGSPREYRGETGAQDSQIPIADSVLEMEYPQNQLTQYLLELRSYRPKDHRAFVAWVKNNATKSQVRTKSLQSSHTAFLLLQNLNVIRNIRAAHWKMTNAYIIKNTKHPKATGGTPITTWLPNQLGGTLEYMETCCARIAQLRAQGDVLDAANQVGFEEIQASTHVHIEALRREVLSLQADFKGTQELTEFEKRDVAHKK